MATNKSNHLQEVLDSYHLNKIEDFENTFLEKKTKIKEAISKEFSAEVVSSPIDSGSYAKKTAINSKFDIDVCIPFKWDSFESLSEMYESVYSFFKSEYEDEEMEGEPLRQKVSIGLTFIVNGKKIEMDVVPGREVNDYKTDEELNLHIYPDLRSHSERMENKTWIKTNIKEHIRHISGKTAPRDIIKLLKVWKHHGASNDPSLKSFLLELITIKAFEEENLEEKKGLWNKLEATLKYMRDNITSRTFVDPANSENKVSDTLNDNQKEEIRRSVVRMLNQIEKDSDNIQSYFPVNEEYSANYETSKDGPTVLNPRKFG